MNIFNFMSELGLSGVGLLAFFLFKHEGRIKKLEAKVEKLMKELALYNGNDEK
jgi:hypothetical protein